MRSLSSSRSVPLGRCPPTSVRYYGRIWNIRRGSGGHKPRRGPWAAPCPQCRAHGRQRQWGDTSPDPRAPEGLGSARVPGSPVKRGILKGAADYGTGPSFGPVPFGSRPLTRALWLLSLAREKVTPPAGHSPARAPDGGIVSLFSKTLKTGLTRSDYCSSILIGLLL